jgi:branched-chain amino acid transport system permease protein
MIPLLSDSYTIYLLNLIGINIIAAISLQILTGFTGLLSIGHAAFFAGGAYVSAYLTSKIGISFWIALPASGLGACLMGFTVSIPTLRMKGLYLAIATMAFSFIIEQIILQWDSVTNGIRGMSLTRPTLGTISFNSDFYYYYIILIIAILIIIGVRNLLRSPTGRALISIRDSEIAAQSMGIPVAQYKIIAFSLSAFCAGVAGCLFAHLMQYISPENFTFMLSISFIVMILIGGLGSIHGAVIGAIFISSLPEIIRYGKDAFPFIKEESGLQMVIYAIILILFVIYEPSGIYGRWLKLKYYFESFPYYKKDTFKRTRKFYKTEKWR